MILIGIDPDAEKSGVAVYDSTHKALSLHNISFFGLYDMLIRIRPDKVYVEAGWLNEKTNWHKGYFNKKTRKWEKYSEGILEKISASTGANHETGKKIIEMLQYLKITYIPIRPQATKVDGKLFEKMTGITRSNQEQRDAAMLILGR